MFFLLSKIFWLIAAPSHVLAWTIIAAAVLMFFGRVRAARWVAAASACITILFGFLPLGIWLMQQHENLYPHPPVPSHVDGILILGGGSDPAIVLGRHALVGGDFGSTRLTGAAILAKRYPSARIVFTGGSGDPRQQEIGEAVSAKIVLLSLGIAPQRLTFEGKSRNTWENFVFTKAIVKPKPGETWLLATSAFHMPRSMAIACKTGWKVTPWATDYLTAPHIRFQPENFADNLRITDLVFKEYLGMAVYRLSGKAA